MWRTVPVPSCPEATSVRMDTRDSSRVRSITASQSKAASGPAGSRPVEVASSLLLVQAPRRSARNIVVNLASTGPCPLAVLTQIPRDPRTSRSSSHRMERAASPRRRASVPRRSKVRSELVRLVASTSWPNTARSSGRDYRRAWRRTPRPNSGISAFSHRSLRPCVRTTRSGSARLDSSGCSRLHR